MATKLAVKSTIVQLDPAGGSTYADIADLVAIMPVEKTRGFTETTVMESANGYREYLASFKDGGQPKIRLRFHKTQYATLDTAFEADTICTWKFKFPLLAGEITASAFTFSAFIGKLGFPEKSAEGTDNWECEVELRISGKPTFAAGS